MANEAKENLYLEEEYKQKLDKLYGNSETAHTQRLANLVDSLEQDILEATDEEILSDFEGMGADEIHKKIVGMVKGIYEKGEGPGD